MRAARIFYTGRVQGVGFRAVVKRVASGFEVTGTVRNLPDGRVELFAQSDETEELDKFLEAVRDGQMYAHIKHEDLREARPEPNERGFRILP